MADKVTAWVLGFAMLYVGGHVVAAAFRDPIFWLFCLPIAGVIGMLVWGMRWQSCK